MTNPSVPDALDALLTPLTLPGGLTLKNRIAMLAMTRTRAAIDGAPTPMMVEYYRQRAEAGLIITESTVVSEVGRGFLNGPGIYTIEQAIEWRKVVDSVHAAGGKIIMQLNHVGRANNLQHRPRPLVPVAPSAIRIPRDSRKITINIPRVTPYDMPRAIGTAEVAMVVAEFAHAARLAKFAGFDGIQVHADSGYLIHQFLSTNVNQRTDRYGGSPQNRARFALEVLDAVIAVTSPQFVSIKLTPGFEVHDIEETDIDEKYGYIIEELNKRKGLSFLHLYFGDLLTSLIFRTMRAQFDGAVLAEGSLTPGQYATLLNDNAMEFTGVARPFIANPDYIARLRNGWALSHTDPETIYGGDEQGYTDYPFYDPANPEGSVFGLNLGRDINPLLKEEAQI